MLQQVNFYHLLPKKLGSRLTWQMIVFIYAVFLLLLIFIYGIELRQKQHLLPQYNKLNSQMAVLQQQLTSLTQKYPITDIVTLENNLHELQKKLADKNKTLNLLIDKTPFSADLLGLAAVNVEGIWLSEIIVDNVEQEIKLKGYALQSGLIEKLLLQLGQEKVFLGAKFKLQNITESPAPPYFEVLARTGEAV